MNHIHKHQPRNNFSVSKITILLLALLCVSTASAQLISLKTIPVATGDQFLIFPSQNMSMGGVHISLADSLLDHWVNPAKGGSIGGIQVSSAPVYYSIGNGYGNARSMPLAVVWNKGIWFGGASFTLQAMNTADNQTWWNPEIRTLSENIAENKYLAGFLGRELGSTSIGVSAYWASLSALDGVDLLYSNSESIDQDGSLTDVRVGLSRTLSSGGEIEMLYLRNELDMKHEVMYMDWGIAPPYERMETNLDHTVTQGLHLAHKSPVDEYGWAYGSMLTVNQKTHPKIPNYEIMNIPRDPGTTLGFNLGGGISKIDGNSTFGIDVIYEPIKSHTWAEADTHMISSEEELIRPGDKTVENYFDFSNWVLRTGLGWKNANRTFQLGMQMRSIHYWLDQTDFIAVTEREQEEYWVEWTTTWGVAMDFDDFTIRYSGKTTMGTGRPGVDTQWLWRGGMLEDMSIGGDFIVAPSDDLTLQEARVMTHQISISLPIRR
ncbi:MAG: hypothetical protein HOB84_03335 [Candidatus Marinimicrobia bacterium]|jgi:hypothetical protein|nr:hypothetical protein [Candidatus Neomarinimicrobiota bacterium]MBT3632138.1 hypothetical protein [Candidatus Neomarinimicrobiota bacterium]MBT3824268.1 hypothetical protein [Candidatus Neomarinimicrobiota bacterium]MBT4129089.1 hypothetical protein [Candidatus Neomarinimicrobiota bacterium]MBT4295642.1 hypothetical protein [Candidatus Neomarinimicrobiota bacterium]